LSLRLCGPRDPCVKDLSASSASSAVPARDRKETLLQSHISSGNDYPLLAQKEKRKLPGDATLAMQKQILANQKKILANQARIQRNQAKLDKIVANQQKLNQILANQKAILARLS
jgi:hypothetical protein